MDENIYMVELSSGRVVYVMYFNVEEVKEHCRQHYPKDVIKSIYKEVYTGVDDGH